MPIDDSIVYRRWSEISTITNVFVDSQDDIRLNLLLMYKLLLGYQIALLFHLSAALHRHAQMRIKAKVYRTLSLLRNLCHQEGSRTVAHICLWSRTPSECRQFLETVQVKLVVLRMCWARPSALFSGRGCARDGTERNAESEEAFSLSSSLEMF